MKLLHGISASLLVAVGIQTNLPAELATYLRAHNLATH
jgi:hypothetical protein